MPQSQEFNETRSQWICPRTQVGEKLALALEDDLGLLAILTAVANEDLEAADFGSRRFLTSWVAMPIGIQEPLQGNIVH